MSVTDFSISNARKKPTYRFLEAFIGIFSISFLIFLLVLSFFYPAWLAIFLIIYSFLMVLKVSLHGVYTIYTYKNLRRWEEFFANYEFKNFSVNQARTKLQESAKKYKNMLDWKQKLNSDIQILEKNQTNKFADPRKIFQIPIFTIYNESSEVLGRSLKAVFESGYDLQNLVVFISQEERFGKENNQKLRDQISLLDWVNVYNLSENNLEIVYNSDHSNLDYTQNAFDKVSLSNHKLNIIFTQHPDGLIGEIKGKASNEDWAGRQISLFTKSQKIDPELVIVTSLDSDSRIGENFFQMLSFRYCLTPDRLKAGFQPLPVYTNNFFSSNVFPRLVATNTTIWHMILYSLLDELHFFANYSVPLVVLQKVDFWVREVIAEDSLLFAKCLVRFKGDFRVVPFYGVFEGDAVSGDDYFEAIINQYRQLQRWAWGGIEGFPYKFYNFFCMEEGNQIDIRKRLKFTFNEFINHFFWSTSPIIFTILVFLPQLFGGNSYRESSVNINLWLFSQYFAWLSFIFLVISSYITFSYIASKALKNYSAKWYDWVIISLQWVISPMIFIMWGPPALNVQIRGIFGWYLGYWVTPKK
jgi:Glycosyl transferase family group 2